MRHAIAASDSLSVWAKQTHTAQFIVDALHRLDLIPHHSRVEIRSSIHWDGTIGGYLRNVIRPKLYTLEKSLRVIRNALYEEWFSLSHFLTRSNLPPHEEEGADITIATYPDSWRGMQESRNRYLGDLVEKLEQSDLSVEYVPAVLGGKARTHFFNATKAISSFRWDIFHQSPWEPLRSLRTLWKIRRAITSARTSIVNNDDLAVDGLDATDWIWIQLNSLSLDNGFQIIHMYRSLRQALSRLEPDILFYKDEVYSTGMAVSSAAPPSTTRWSFQHGAIVKNHLAYAIDGRFVSANKSPDSHHIPMPDLFLSYGEDITNHVTQFGYPSTRVNAIGSFRHDALFRLSRQYEGEAKRIDLRRQLGIDEKRSVVLICTQLPRNVPLWLKMVVRGCRQSAIDNPLILIKSHPRYPVDGIVDSHMSQMEWSEYRIYHDKLHELLIIADVMITGGSTTGLEALTLGCPLITIESKDGIDHLPYVEEGVALAASDTTSMVDALNRVIDPMFLKERKPMIDCFLRRQFSPSLGSATLELIDLFKAHKSAQSSHLL